MTRRLLQTTFSLLLATSVALQAFSQEAIHLTLADALERAPAANFEILIGQERLVAQEQAQRRARANLFPQISAGAGQQRSQSFLPNMRDELRETAITNRFDALLRASFSIFDVNNYAEARVERFNTEIARLTLRSTIEDILQAIARTYFTHLRNLRREAAIQADISRDQALLELATNRFEAGAATEIDVTRAEVALATNRLRLAQQETIVEESALELKRALNFRLGAEVIVSDPNLPAFEGSTFSPNELAQILNRRPETVSAERTLDRNEVARRAARLQRLPTVSASGSYGYAGETFDSDLEEVWSAGIDVNVPLFDGFRIEANQREAASVVRQQELIVQQLDAAVEAEYRIVLSQLRSTNQQVEIARQQVALADRELELARIRFEEGVADNREVVEAQANVAQANDGLVEAEYQFNLARLAFARVRGEVHSILTASR